MVKNGLADFKNASLKDYADAINDYTIAININKEYTEAYDEVGLYYMSQKKNNHLVIFLKL